MYRAKDYFKTLPIDKNSQYLKYFLNFYRGDILKYFPTIDIDVEGADMSFYILRNVMPAGLFVGNKFDDKTLLIEFDYVVPTFRDFKMGSYIFKDKKEMFIDKGFDSLITFTRNEAHEKYLLKMGFRRDESMCQKTNICYRYKLN